MDNGYQTNKQMQEMKKVMQKISQFKILLAPTILKYTQKIGN